MSNSANAAQTGMLTVLKGITWVVYVFCSAAEIFLAFMFFLQLLGANPNQTFVALIYRGGAFFGRPFKGIFPNTVLSAKAFVNWNAVVAFVAYAVLAWLIGRAVGSVGRRLRVQQAKAAAEQAPAPAITAPRGDSQPRA